MALATMKAPVPRETHAQGETAQEFRCHVMMTTPAQETSATWSPDVLSIPCPGCVTTEVTVPREIPAWRGPVWRVSLFNALPDLVR